MGAGLRYFGGAVAFGFAALWIMASLVAALTCASAAVLGYSAVLVVERTQAKLAARASSRKRAAPSMPAPLRKPPNVADLPQWADTLNSDLGHVYEPGAVSLPLSAEAAYGWPLEDGTAVVSETLH